MFLDFPPQRFFMGTIMALYVVVFSYFSHRVLVIFAKAFIISSDFSH
jgi:hypothetical protein